MSATPATAHGASERRQAVLDTACARLLRARATAAPRRPRSPARRASPSRSSTATSARSATSTSPASTRPGAAFREFAEEALAEDPDGCLGAIADAYMAKRSRLRLVDLWIQALTEAAEDAVIAKAVRGQIREMHDFFADVIRRGQAGGVVHPDRDPVAEAWIFIAGGLLATIDHRLGGLLGGDLERVRAVAPRLDGARQARRTLPAKATPTARRLDGAANERAPAAAAASFPLNDAGYGGCGPRRGPVDSEPRQKMGERRCDGPAPTPGGESLMQPKPIQKQRLDERKLPAGQSACATRASARPATAAPATAPRRSARSCTTGARTRRCARRSRRPSPRRRRGGPPPPPRLNEGKRVGPSSRVRSAGRRGVARGRRGRAADRPHPRRRAVQAERAARLPARPRAARPARPRRRAALRRPPRRPAGARRPADRPGPVRLEGAERDRRRPGRLPARARARRASPSTRPSTSASRTGRSRATGPPSAAEAARAARRAPAADRGRSTATAFYAGLRRGELRGLRWEDVDLAAGDDPRPSRLGRRRRARSRRSRAKGTRTVPIVAVLRDDLAEHKAATATGASSCSGRSTASRSRHRTSASAPRPGPPRTRARAKRSGRRSSRSASTSAATPSSRSCSTLASRSSGSATTSGTARRTWSTATGTCSKATRPRLARLVDDYLARADTAARVEQLGARNEPPTGLDHDVASQRWVTKT